MLVQRRRRWADIKPASVERLVFVADSVYIDILYPLYE